MCGECPQRKHIYCVFISGTDGVFTAMCSRSKLVIQSFTCFGNLYLRYFQSFANISVYAPIRVLMTQVPSPHLSFHDPLKYSNHHNPAQGRGQSESRCEMITS